MRPGLSPAARSGNPTSLAGRRDEYFGILFRAIEEAGGTVVKTIGDAVMASFITNVQAFQAVSNTVARFEEYNEKHSEDERIRVRIGIHRGSVLLVNLNDRLDYFGRTVNKASRLQSAAGRGEISFSAEVRKDRAFCAALQRNGVSQIKKGYRYLKGLSTRQAVYTARLSPG